jgi:hypothetical protein
MKGLGLKLLKIHLLFLAFLPLFIDRSRDGKNGTKTRENPVLVQMCAPVQTISQVSQSPEIIGTYLCSRNLQTVATFRTWIFLRNSEN